jgi:ribosomal protein S18 acetylase RimI-like enzyme
MTPIRLRPATIADVDDAAVLRVLRSAVADARVIVAAAITDGICLVAHDDGVVVGCVCVSRAGADGWTISAIAVAQDHRGMGIGRLLVTGALERLESRSLYAETDGDAVEFYRQLGFAVSSLGEKYPGVERFACRLASG